MSLIIKNFNKEDKSSKVPKECANSGFKVLVTQHRASMAYMLMLCFPGAIVAYFLVTIVPNILAEILHGSSQNIPAITIVGILVFGVNVLCVCTSYKNLLTLKRLLQVV